MTSPLPGFPPEVVTADTEDAAAHFVLDEAVFPLDVVFATAYAFIDRCYVVLDRPESGRHRVTLALKEVAAGGAALRALVGEFANELLASGWRHQVHAQNRELIDSVTRAAFGGALGTPAVEELAALDYADDPLEDPLGIAVPWEQRFGGQDKPEPKP